MFSRLELITIAIALIGLGMSTRGIAQEYSSVIEQQRRVEPGSRIAIRNEFGDIRIAGSDRNTVEAVATDLNSSRKVPVTISEGSSGNKRVITVSAVETGRVVEKQNVSILLDVKVPRDVEFEPIYVRIGNISVVDLDGGVNLRTDNGNISVRRAGSPKGGLVAATIGSGNVDLSNINGDVRITAISSNVAVRCVKGDVAARTSSGQIAVSNTAGHVDANSSSGGVSFTGAIFPEGRYRLKTMSGDASMTIPDTIGFTAVLSAYSGQIHTDFQFPNGSQTSPSKTEQRVIGKYGDGSGRIELDSFSGNVFLRKIAAIGVEDCQK